jgi:hypothetical protein
MSSPSIRIRFIRANGSAKNDDTVVIYHLGANQFSLAYTYGETDTKNPRKVVLTDRGVFRWMRNLIGLLEKDVDPFQHVQLDLPFMPSVLFDATKLGDTYHTILDAVEFHLDNWPVRRAPALNPEEDEEDDDEEFNEEELEEDDYADYADMPNLEPMPSPINRWNNSHIYIDENHRSGSGRHHLFLDEDN